MYVCMYVCVRMCVCVYVCVCVSVSTINGQKPAEIAESNQFGSESLKIV